jgi:two-component system nitrate/nitrite response regulator NarL
LPKTILIVDDHAHVRKAVCEFFTTATEFSICGEAVDGLQAIEMAGRLKPDLIILDASMPRMNGIEAAPRLKEIAPEAPIILFTLHEDSLRGIDTKRLGVSAVVCKTAGLSVLADYVMRLLPATG